MQSSSRLHIVAHDAATRMSCDEEIEIERCELSIYNISEFFDGFLDEFASFLQLIVHLIALLIQISPQMHTFSLRKCTETSQDSG